MNRFIILCSAILILTTSSWHQAHAHGGLAIEEDICKLRISREYSMHMSGYIQDTLGVKEFCEDIPDIGRVIVVFDMIQTHLRKHETEVRIVKDKGPNTDIKANTIMYLPFQTYKSGTLNFDHTYEKKGKYIGIVSVRDHDKLLVSKFPFSVGYGDTKKNTKQVGYTVALFLAFIAFAAWYRARIVRKRSAARTAAS